MMRAQQLQNDCPQALAALDITRQNVCCVCIYFFAPLVCYFLPQIVFTARIISLDIKNSAPISLPRRSIDHFLSQNSPGSHTLIYDSRVTRELPLVVCLLSALIYWFWNCCATGYAFYWTKRTVLIHLHTTTHTLLYIYVFHRGAAHIAYFHVLYWFMSLAWGSSNLTSMCMELIIE
jgi:hypothetical protein